MIRTASIILSILTAVWFIYYFFVRQSEPFDNEPKWLDGIDVIYWINLDRSEERRTWMEKLFEDPVFQDIPNERISAIDGKIPGLIDSMLLSDKQPITDPEYGCLLSHLETIKKFADSKYEIALILEDDNTLDLKTYWKKNLRTIINNAPEDWGIIQLTAKTNYGFLDEEYKLNMGNGDIACAGAYIINKKTATDLIKEIHKNEKYYMNSKYYHIADQFIYEKCKTYAYKYPFFIYRNSNDSTLHPDHLNGHQLYRDQIIKQYESLSKSDWLTGIDAVYWINLDRSEDRRICMQKLFDDPVFQNIPNERVSAIDGKKPGLIESLLNIPKKQDGHTDIVYACLLSHLNAIREFSNSNYNVALIAEDDICLDFKKYWKTPIKNVIDNAPADWEIIQLYYFVGDKFLNKNYTLNVNSEYPSAVAYLINKKGSKKLMEGTYVNNKYKLKMEHPHSADNYIYRELTSYVYKYPYITHRTENDSTLHQEHVDTIHTPFKMNAIKAFENEISVK
jgi:GR25 family glycosyltransferase involved in LPS biosynthesis